MSVLRNNRAAPTVVDPRGDQIDVLTNICVELANEGTIENTWKAKNRNKPFDSSSIAMLNLD